MAKQPVTQPAPRDHEWAQAVDGADIQTPSNGLKDAGYDGLDIPDHRDFNGLFRDWDQTMRYWMQKTVAAWHASETYAVGDLTRYNGAFYVAVVTPTVGVTPATNEDLSARQWERWYRSPFGVDETDVDNVPVQRWRNAKSSPANQIDRLGFFGGPRVSQWLETWRGDDSNLTTGSVVFEKTNRRWSTAVTAGGTGGGITVSDPADLARFVSLTIGSGAGSSADESAMGAGKETRFTTDAQFALEFTVLTGGNVDLMRVACGISNAEFYGETNSFVGIILAKGNGNANWQMIVGDGAARTTVDTGVAVAASTSYDIRIEWLGSGKAKDGASQARAYINGSRTSGMRITTNLPIGATFKDVQTSLRLKRDTGTAARGVSILPVRFSHSY